MKEYLLLRVNKRYLKFMNMTFENLNFYIQYLLHIYINMTFLLLRVCVCVVILKNAHRANKNYLTIYFLFFISFLKSIKHFIQLCFKPFITNIKNITTTIPLILHSLLILKI